MQGTAKLYFQLSGPENQVFSVMYRSICEDLNQVPSGTSAHKQFVLNQLIEGKAFQAKGEHVALRRWFSWLDAAHGFDPIYNSRLLICIIYGMQCKLYKDLQDIPLWNYSGDDQPAPTLEPDDEGEDDVDEDVAEEIADAKEADVKVADAVGKNMKADDTKAQVNAKDEISKMRLSCKSN